LSAPKGEGPSGPIRLQKLLAGAGVASRRAAEKLIREGRVAVNGVVATIGDSADPFVDDVTLDGESLRAENASYWLVNKPKGVLTTMSDPEHRRTILSLLPDTEHRLFPVGRLDLDTEGLVLMTNDGELAHRLLHPSHETEREYVVRVRGRFEKPARERLAKGVRLQDGVTGPGRVERVRYDKDRDDTTFHFTIREGRKRQIRRSLLALGHPVRALQRVRMGPLHLGRLPIGKARRATPREKAALERLRRGEPAESGGRQGARSSRPKAGRSRAKSRSSKTPRD
jgi:23S rRNA pseudouridine2605 synthase